MENFGKVRESFFRKFPGLPNGISDGRTFARVFDFINPKELTDCLRQWFADIGGPDGREINIDGKTVRGSVCKSLGSKAASIVRRYWGAKSGSRAKSDRGEDQRDYVDIGSPG